PPEFVYPANPSTISSALPRRARPSHPAPTTSSLAAPSQASVSRAPPFSVCSNIESLQAIGIAIFNSRGLRLHRYNRAFNGKEGPVHVATALLAGLGLTASGLFT